MRETLYRKCAACNYKKKEIKWINILVILTYLRGNTPLKAPTLALHMETQVKDENPSEK
jgi:hypothetical protein